MPITPTVTTTAFTALRFLPIPLLVLSSSKTVVLANEAVGRLLGLNVTALAEDGNKDPTAALSKTDLLCGKEVSQLGIDVLRGGFPIWDTWEVNDTMSVFVWTH